MDRPREYFLSSSCFAGDQARQITFSVLRDFLHQLDCVRVCAHKPRLQTAGYGLHTPIVQLMVEHPATSHVKMVEARREHSERTGSAKSLGLYDRRPIRPVPELELILANSYAVRCILGHSPPIRIHLPRSRSRAPPHSDS